MSSERARPSTIVLSVIAALLAVAVVVALAMLLGRNTSATSADSSGDSGDSAEAPATEGDADGGTDADAGADGASIAVSGSGFTLTDASGTVVYTHDWAAETDEAVAALSDAFGTEPTDDFVEGDAENWAYDVFDWDGFRLYDVRIGDGNRPRDEIPAPTYVSWSANEVHDVAVTDEFGLEIGMGADEAAALGADSESAEQLVFGTDRGTFWSDGNRDFSAFAALDAGAVSNVTYTFFQGEN